MAHTNIDLFNRFALALFAELYKSFPVPADLDFESIMMSVIPDNADDERTFNSLAITSEAVNFLETEGFLHIGFKSMNRREFSQVRLTMKGLAILDSVPTSLEKRESIISSISAITKKGLKQAASDQVSDLAKHVFTLAIASGPTLTSLLR